MPCEVYWIEEPDILAIDCRGPITSREMTQVIGQCLAVVDQQPAHFLIDLSQVAEQPVDFVVMNAFSEWIYHPNARWFVYINASDLLRSLVTVRHRGGCRFFKRRETAVEFLRGATQYETERH